MVRLLVLLVALASELRADEQVTFQDVQDRLKLLSRDDVCEELNMSIAQRRADRETERGRELSKEYSRTFDKLTAAERNAAQLEIYVESLKAVEAPLTQDQLSRLDQLHRQYQTLEYGTPFVAERVVELTPEVKRTIREKEAELGTEVREMMWSFHDHAQFELKEILTPKQRVQWSELIGEDFKFGPTPQSAPLSLLGTLVNRFIASYSIRGWAPLPNETDLKDDGFLLSRSDVQKELELVDDQIEGLQKNRKAFNERMNAQSAEHAKLENSDITVEEKIQRYRELRENQLKLSEELLLGKLRLRQEQLLPHQLRRLSQLRWRYRALNDPVAAFSQGVDLTAEQFNKMRAKERELTKELTAKMWTSHIQAQQEIIGSLTPDQRAAWTQSVGPHFEFQSEASGLGILRRLY